ncbi:hypothetical protein PCH70_14070 [Pseudomonas cichorii JBC1]|nr:hypothetical protein PCH70_14070 [Pseudomonas cichorii JBC1]SDP26492.1 hypothetical protein SAMN05216599_1264 [Pseudomonas cichorii]
MNDEMTDLYRTFFYTRSNRPMLVDLHVQLSVIHTTSVAKEQKPCLSSQTPKN